MKKLMILVMTMSLVACSDDPKETPAKAVTQAAAQPDILSYIPADTPLLLVSGINPDQYPDRYQEVMQSNMDGAVKYLEVFMKQAMKTAEKKQAELAEALAETLESEGMPEDVESITIDSTDQNEMATKAMSFLDKWLIQDKFNKVGLKVGETQIAVYMVDLFPVVRIKLSAGNQMEAMLTEAQQEFDLPMTMTEVSGIKVREIAAEKITVLLATDGEYLTISGAPAVIKDQLINQLIGAEKPATTLANDRSLMDQVKQAHGYTNDDLMVVDFQTLADHFINPAKHNSALVNFLQIEDNMLSAVCKAEITALIGHAPRMVAGNKQLTNDTIHGTFVWEMDAALAADMATLAGRIPHGNADAAFAFGMSFDLMGAKDVAVKYANDLVASPYACEHLAPLNQQAAEMQAKLSQPIPPFVGNFKGFNLSLDELKLNLENANLANPDPNEMIESLKTQIFLAVDETEALMGMAQMMVPQLQGMELKTDGSLITLADKVPMISGKDVPFDISHLYAAISADTIGLSLGHEGGGELSEKVQDSGKQALIAMSASAEGYRQLMEQVFAMADMPNMPQSVKEELQMQKELTLSMLYWTHQDVSMGFSDQGFETDFVIKY
ncbi:hypothetical protein ACFODZ_10910 [Marinicella sediminis]|uniref:DUF3352 domain-containing protein n=1 Tax=Marinicella sediminis TaxID=1792834 RepID=A0ABV7J9E1_9GAMM|nr:hypothetical protein [Marinicella sediminis]